MRFIKRVTDRGSVTLPSDVREALGVREGDIVEFEIVAVVKRAGGPPLKGRAVPGASGDTEAASQAREAASREGSRPSVG